MKDLLTSKTKRFVILFIAFFIVLGAVLLLQGKLNPNDNGSSEVPSVEISVTKKSYTGRITYLSPQLYPEDEISYVLTDSSGKEVILLKAEDQKLMVSEGLFATVSGRMKKTADKKEDVLLVDEVIVKNVAD